MAERQPTTVSFLVAFFLVLTGCDDSPLVSGFVPPVIDGIRGSEEWANATQVVAFEGAILFYMNDAENLYIALEVEDESFDASDRFEVRFDNDRDGALEDFENNLRINGAQFFVDAHSFQGNWGFQDPSSHGSGAAGGSAGLVFFEIEHPLNSGDAEDFALSSGDRVGYCAIFGRDGTTTGSTAYPQDCLSFGADLSGYAEILVE
jgi:hypothetical protein